jgi:hypothetical protein
MRNPIALFFRWPPLGNIGMGYFIFVPFPGYIEVAVATAIFLNILLTVEAGTKDIPVPPPVSGGKTTGTGHISVAVLVDEQITDNAQGPPAVPVEEISLWLLNLL